MRPFRKFIAIDVMLRGHFVHTFHVSILLADFIDNNGIPSFSMSTLQGYVEDRLPSLKGKPYNICF